jgi:hypothetical protein
MLLGFFDDSGKESDPSNKIVCAAGYIASGASFWNSFQEMWKNFLLAHGLDQLHMRELMWSQSKTEPYASWDWPMKKRVLESFSTAIKASYLIGFGVAVDADAWRGLPPELTKREGTAQEFCFMRLIHMIVKKMKSAAPEEKISIMFDCDQEFTSARFQRYLGLRQRDTDAARYLTAFSIGEPVAWLPLQAADFLAWETRAYLLRQMKGLPDRPEFQHMMRVLPGFIPQYEGEFWTKERIETDILPMANHV